MGVFTYILLFLVLLAVAAVVVGMWMIFEKAGRPGWKALIPVYNLIILLDIIGRASADLAELDLLGRAAATNVIHAPPRPTRPAHVDRPAAAGRLGAPPHRRGPTRHGR